MMKRIEERQRERKKGRERGKKSERCILKRKREWEGEGVTKWHRGKEKKTKREKGRDNIF